MIEWQVFVVERMRSIERHYQFDGNKSIQMAY